MVFILVFPFAFIFSLHLLNNNSLVVQLLSQGAFGYLLPIISFILAWIETWLLDFKVLPQEAGDEISESQTSYYTN